MYRRYWLVLGIMILLTPIGIWAEGTAWGEWGAEDLAGMLGFVPQGIGQVTEWWQSVFPDYRMNFLGEGRTAESTGYIISAFIGSILVYTAMLGYIKLMTRTGTKQ